MSQQLHDFAVPAAFGLPPGLERDNGYYLRCTPDCHCQSLLRSGNLVRAVNVVECTRLIDSLNDNGDNQGLLFHASVPIMIRDQMLGILNAATEEWQFLTAADLQFLTTVGAQVTAALERAQLYDELAAQRVRLEREINMARAVQASLIPQNLPEIPGFSISAVWHAAREMAGDFYDVFELPDGRWAVLIADVSDKGAPAALFMAMTRSLIRASASVHTSPAMTLKEVNLRVNAHSSSGMFVTVFYAILDAQASTLCYANAGQDPPLLRRASGELEKLMPTGALIGVFDELVITDGLLTLNPGDILVAYTDGITDALDPQGSAYGLKRLCTILMETSHCTAKPLLSCLMDDLTSFVQQAPAFDDITMLVIANEGSI